MVRRSISRCADSYRHAPARFEPRALPQPSRAVAQPRARLALASLCPAHEPLTEACFQRAPLKFASRTHSLEMADGTTATINGSYVSEGTRPRGSEWAMNPLPYSNAASPPEFAPPCDETVDRTKSDTGRCSGRDPYNTLIGDDLVVPADLPKGDYVLGIRWDCEKSAQVWQGCADIEIV
jgi:hypothetical protein